MNLNQKQLAVVKRLAKRWRERAVPLAPGQLRLHLNPDWVSQNWRDFNRIKKYKTKKSTIYLIPRGFPTFLTPEEKAGLATGLVWVVFPKSKNKKSIVIKHYAPSSRGQANLFKYQRRLFKRGEPVPEPLKLLEAGKGNKKLVWIESEEGIAINQLDDIASKEERAVLSDVYEDFIKKHPKVAGEKLAKDFDKYFVNTWNIVINPRTGKVKRIDLAG